MATVAAWGPAAAATPSAAAMEVLAACMAVAGSPGQVQVGAEAGGDQAADDGHAEGAADLADGVVDGAAGPGLVLRQGGHDRLGRRGHDQPHAGAHQHHGDGDAGVAGAGGHQAEPPQSAAMSNSPAGITARTPNRRARTLLSGETPAMAMANGKARTPAARVV